VCWKSTNAIPTTAARQSRIPRRLIEDTRGALSERERLLLAEAGYGELAAERLRNHLRI
jgi:hypothetical protein